MEWQQAGLGWARLAALCGAACAIAACSSSPNGMNEADSSPPETDAARAGQDTAADAADTGSPSTDAGRAIDGTTSSDDGGHGGTTDASSDVAARDATAMRADNGSLTYPPAAAAMGTIDDGLAQLNLYRALVGLGTVTLDQPTSASCAAHLQYLTCAADAGAGMGYLEHTETAFPQCAIDGGEPAGEDSDLAWGESSSNRQTVGQDFTQAIDLWINGLYHRTPLLDPGLMKIGGASSQGYNCLNYAGGNNTVTARAATPVLFPPDGTTDVPREFTGDEGPCPTATDPQNATTCPGSGFIVSANYYGWSTGNKSAITAVSSATLIDTTADADVPLFAWYADTIAGHDPAPGFVRNEIALVPQATLASGHTFSVAIQGTVSNRAMNLTWSFTTGTRTQ